MQLIDLLKAYPEEEIMAAIDDMFPGTEQYRHIFSEAYRMMLTLTLVPSKKRLRYRILSDEENEIEYFGAEDTQFNTTWEVCLAKELTVDEGVELTQLEIAANSLVNLCFIGRCPRPFLPLKEELLRAVQ